MAPREVKTVDTEMQGTHQLGRLWQEGAGGILLPVALADGTEVIPTGHVVTRHASGKWVGAAPTGGTGGSGGGGAGALVMLKEATGVAVASLDLEDWYSTDYDQYVVEVVNVRTSALTYLGWRMGLAGVYDATALYDWNSAYSYDGGAGRDGQTSATAINFRGTDTTLSANSAYNGTFRLYDPGNTAFYKYMTGQVVWDYAAVASLWLENWGGRYRNVAAVDSLRLVPSNGTLTGTIRIYGVSKQEGAGSGATSGVGPGQIVKNADTHAADDTFDSDSGLWTDVNWSGATTTNYNSTIPGALFVQHPATGATILRAKLKAIDAGDWSKVLDITTALRNTAGVGIGLMFSDGTTNGAGNQNIVYVTQSSGVRVSGGARYTNFGSFAAVTLTAAAWAGGERVLLRVDRLAGVYTVYFGYVDPEGIIHWSAGETMTMTGVISHYGIFYGSTNSGQPLTLAFHGIYHFPTSYPTDGMAVEAVGGGSGGSTVSLPLRASALPYTTNLAFHHRPDIGITMDASNRVANWSDPAFVAKDIAQATAINQPIWDPTALNGRPGLRFKRNQWLNRTTSAALAATDNYTIFIVLQPDLTTDEYGYVAFCNGSTATGISILNGQEALAATQNRIVTLVNAVAWQSSSWYYSAGAVTILCVQRAAGTTTLYRHDGVLSPTYATTPIMPTEHWVGWDGQPGRKFNGVIGDIIVFNEAMSAADREAIMRYLGEYYGIPTYA
jgi:hypothetical protein